MEPIADEHPDYRRIAEAVAFLTEMAPAQPTLAEVAAHVHLSPYHFERLFRRWVGLTPKQFTRHLSLDHARRLLASQHSVLDATLEVGLSSPSRLHDLFVTLDAVTPGTFKAQGDGLTIRYGFHLTAFGLALVGRTDRGVCHLAFGVADGHEALQRTLAEAWPAATCVEDPAATLPVVAPLTTPTATAQPLRLLVQGTNLQVKVWDALLRIPAGTVATYQQVANAIGRPRAVRAVANAIGRNPVAFLIPCHRVLRTGGGLGGYRWGMPRKRALLAWEAAIHQDDATAPLAEVAPLFVEK